MIDQEQLLPEYQTHTHEYKYNWKNLSKITGYYQWQHSGFDNILVLKDVTFGRNWVKGTWGLLFLTTACIATIISIQISISKCCFNPETLGCCRIQLVTFPKKTGRKGVRKWVKQKWSRSEHETSQWERLLHYTALSENIRTYPHCLLQVTMSKSKMLLQKTQFKSLDFKDLKHEAQKIICQTWKFWGKKRRLAFQFWHSQGLLKQDK